MIHLRKETEHLKLGLNITLGRTGWWPWITFVWCWYNVQDHEMTARRLRIRTHMAPRILISNVERNMTENYLRMNDLIAVPRELLEDFEPRLVLMANHFNQQFRAGEINRYYG